MHDTYDTADHVSLDTLALIFWAGQPDESGIHFTLGMFGERNGQRTVIFDRLHPSLYAVRSALRVAQVGQFTKLSLHPNWPSDTGLAA